MADLTLATGHALYCSMNAPGRVAVAFFGDGGGNQGAFHEAMNLAALLSCTWRESSAALFWFLA